MIKKKKFTDYFIFHVSMPALSPSLESESLHKTKSYKARKGRITEKKMQTKNWETLSWSAKPEKNGGS